MKKENIKNDFMFKTVMSDSKILKEFLRRVLPDLEIFDLRIVINEKNVESGLDYHSVRFDIYGEDKERLYDVEMQTCEDNDDLLKRTRYYHTLMDVENLKKGKKYSYLKDSFVIFVCDFDPFGDNMYMYTISHHCKETNKYVNEGRKTIFINLKGKKGNITDGLKHFITYASTGIVGDKFTKEIDKEVRKYRDNPSWRKEKMSLEVKLELRENMGIKQGIKQGMKQGIKQGVEQGVKQGMKQGILNMYTFIMKQNKDLDPIKEIAESFDMTSDEIERIINESKNENNFHKK